MACQELLEWWPCKLFSPRILNLRSARIETILSLFRVRWEAGMGMDAYFSWMNERTITLVKGLYLVQSCHPNAHTRANPIPISVPGPIK